jgi:DNA-binding beta-propeller fold protein YncE
MLRLWLLVPLLAVSIHAQNEDARAADLRALLRATPRLPLQAVPLAARLPNAASLGTVSSVASDSRGLIYVLQRGDKADPVIAIDPQGRILRSWGKGMFTVPHSIRVDPEGNIWTVDAGSSVLLEFTPEGKKLRQIVVGEVATGSDCAFPTLCGTTDVAFGPGGRLFISDGYGNARILEYTRDGRRIRVWGSKGTGPGQFRIPHGVAFDGQVLYVADRTNARVQRFDPGGRYLGEWTHLGRPFALKFTDGALWVALMTLETGAGKASPWIVKVDPSSGKVLAQIEAPGPHSIDVNGADEVFAGGCCGGSHPMDFFWLRNVPGHARK